MYRMRRSCPDHHRCKKEDSRKNRVHLRSRFSREDYDELKLDRFQYHHDICGRIITVMYRAKDRGKKVPHLALGWTSWKYNESPIEEEEANWINTYLYPLVRSYEEAKEEYRRLNERETDLSAVCCLISSKVIGSPYIPGLENAFLDAIHAYDCLGLNKLRMKLEYTMEELEEKIVELLSQDKEVD